MNVCVCGRDGEIDKEAFVSLFSGVWFQNMCHGGVAVKSGPVLFVLCCIRVWGAPHTLLRVLYMF